MALTLKSSVFKNNGEIPVRYTGEGEDISPPLEWSNVPKGTRSFLIICEDPDAPQSEPFVHWLIYNIANSISSLPEGIPDQERVSGPIPADQGINSFGNIGYGGPLPPVGHGIHHYIFKLYALNADLGLQAGLKKEDIFKAIEGHIIDATQLVGKYKRERLEKTA